MKAAVRDASDIRPMVIAVTEVLLEVQNGEVFEPFSNLYSDTCTGSTGL
jgi:hypothetical protein